MFSKPSATDSSTLTATSSHPALQKHPCAELCKQLLLHWKMEKHSCHRLQKVKVISSFHKAKCSFQRWNSVIFPFKYSQNILEYSCLYSWQFSATTLEVSVDPTFTQRKSPVKKRLCIWVKGWVGWSDFRTKLRSQSWHCRTKTKKQNLNELVFTRDILVEISFVNYQIQSGTSAKSLTK